MPTVDRTLRTPAAVALLELTGELASKELVPRAAENEEAGRFPR